MRFTSGVSAGALLQPAANVPAASAVASTATTVLLPISGTPPEEDDFPILSSGRRSRRAVSGHAPQPEVGRDPAGVGGASDASMAQRERLVTLFLGANVEELVDEDVPELVGAETVRRGVPAGAVAVEDLDLGSLEPGDVVERRARRRLDHDSTDGVHLPWSERRVHEVTRQSPDVVVTGANVELSAAAYLDEADRRHLGQCRVRDAPLDADRIRPPVRGELA